jgi:WD40 repeat protein
LSSDGIWLAYITEGSTVFLGDPRPGGQPGGFRQVRDLHFGNVALSALSFTLAPDEAFGNPPLRFSPDGSLLVTGRSGDLGVFLFVTDVAKRKLKWTLAPKSTRGLTDYVFSHNGKLLAAGHGWVTLWNVDTGEQTLSISKEEAPDAVLTALAFTPDDKKLVAAGHDAKTGEFLIQVWNLAPLQLSATHRLPGKVNANTLRENCQIVISRDASTVAWIADRVKLYVAEVGGKERLLDQSASGGGKESTPEIAEVINFAPDGKLLLTRGSTSPEVFHVWDVAAGTKRWTLKTGNTSKDKGGAEFSADGKRLVLLDPHTRKIKIDRMHENAPVK